MPTKKEILETNTIAHQEALVHKLLANGPRAVKRIIPGGKTLLKQVSKENMGQTIYNWLRGCASFSEVKLSLAKNPDTLPTRTTRIMSFDTRSPKLWWETDHTSRTTLANEMAKLMNTMRLIAIHVKPDGIYAIEDTSGKFGPTVVITKALAEKPEYQGATVGETVPSADWEPYLEFVPKGKNPYTQFDRSR